MTENIGENFAEKDKTPDFIFTDKEEQMRARREKLLKNENVDAEDYRQYFDVIEKLYAPVGNFLADFNFFVGGVEAKTINDKKEISIIIENMIRNWQKVLEVYKHINYDELTKETGKKWIEMMAPLVDKFSERLIAIKSAADNEQDITEEIEDAVATENSLRGYRKQLGILPAYTAYREYGQYENSDALPEDKFK